jgi:aminoglycoside N3'-acetyltransferase
MTFDEFTDGLGGLIPRVPSPIVVYSGLFAIARALPPPEERLAANVLDCLLSAAGPDRTVLMPTYTSGFREGRIDLSRAACTTGMVNERFRCMSGTLRTASAFFSFAVRGPDAAELAALRPANAWGEHSVFDWIDRHNATLVMIGVPWAMCSFLHRAEWLARVPYRYDKRFTGTCVIDGAEETLTETLFVRSLDPPAWNIWPDLEDLLAPHGMRRFTIGRGYAASMAARDLMGAITPVLGRDPFRFVQNSEALRAAFNPGTGGRAMEDA